MLKRTLTGLLLVVALVSSGCNRGGAEQKTETNEQDLPMKFSLELRGDLDVTLKKHTAETKVIVVRTDNPQAKVYQVLGVEVIEPVKVGDTAVRPGFAVIPFEGNGKYTIKAGSPYENATKATGGDASQPAAVTSSVRVEWWASDGQTYEYLRREKPCTVHVEKDGMKGSLDCPRVTQDGGGKVFSMKFSWEKP